VWRLSHKLLPNMNHMHRNMEATHISTSWNQGILVLVTSQLVHVPFRVGTSQRVNHRAYVYVFHFEIIGEALGFIDNGLIYLKTISCNSLCRHVPSI
jgi:hypothetical protein